MRKLINPLYYKGIDLHHAVIVDGDKLAGFILLRSKFTSTRDVEVKARALLKTLVKGFNINQMINIIKADEGDKPFTNATWIGVGGNVTSTPDLLHWSAVERQARRELQALYLLSQVVFDYNLQDLLQAEFIRLQDKQFKAIL